MAAPQVTKPLSRPVAAVAWALWFAALFGLPPVLSLPSAFSIESVALAFSGTRALMAFAVLAGCALRRGCKSADKKAASRLFMVGLAATVAYVALLGIAFARDLSMGANLAVYLSFIAVVLSVLGSLCWSLSLPNFACADRDTSLAMQRPALLLAFAAASAGILLLSVGLEPCLTLARSSFANAFQGSEGEWWHVLAYDLAGVVGPGAHPLRLGTAGAEASQLIVVAAWFVAGLAALCSSVPVIAACGTAAGVLACRWAFSCVEYNFAMASMAGLALLFIAIVLMVICAAWRRSPKPETLGREGQSSSVASDSRLSALSAREREAVEGRLRGLSSAEVAASMGVQPSTVRNLQSRAAAKLGVQTLDELHGSETDGVARIERHRAFLASRRVSVLSLLGVALCVALLLVAGKMLGRNEWTTQALLGEMLVTAALLTNGASRFGVRSEGGDLPVSIAWALTALQLGLIAAILTADVENMSAVATVLSLAALAIDLLVLLRHRLLPAWGTTFPLYLLFLGLGLVLGAWVSWPLFASQGMLVIRDATSGLVAVSAISGFIFGTVLLLGLVSATYVSLACAAHDDFEAAIGSSEARFEQRARAYFASRGLNETQVEVAWCVLNGMPRERVAHECNLSVGTVNSAKRAAYRALGVHSSAELVRLTMRMVK